jgi:Uma2 family endonuclease
MPVSEATFKQLALEDHKGKWELVCGELRRKPPMTTPHGETARHVLRHLVTQLPQGEYSVGQESPNLRVPGGNYRIPDVCVIPRNAVRRNWVEKPHELEVYEEPMPLVVEVWSPSTGEADLQQKLKEYQERGDLEIWRIHPVEHTLIAWRKQADGRYTETLYTGGVIRPTALPTVVIDLDALFDQP